MIPWHPPVYVNLVLDSIKWCPCIGGPSSSTFTSLSLHGSLSNFHKSFLWLRLQPKIWPLQCACIFWSGIRQQEYWYYNPLTVKIYVAVLCYDYTLTFALEYNLFWFKFQFSWASYLYFLNRYVTLFAYVLILAEPFLDYDQTVRDTAIASFS